MRAAAFALMSFVAVTVTGAAAAEFGPVDPPRAFPEVSAKNLSGETYAMPGDFEGAANVVVLAYEQEQQRLVDTWLGPLGELAAEEPRLRYYELPTISRMNSFMRWFINNGMRSGIPSDAQRGRTITLYIDKAPFKDALGIETESTIHTFLLDGAGHAVWRADGPATPEALEALRAAVAETLAP